ncbi:MAG: metallophosphoesterase [Opitutaceae bacterium]
MIRCLSPRVGICLFTVFSVVLSIAQAHEEQPTGLVPPHSTWKFDDDGEADAGWNDAKFDDSAWRSGAAPLGYGEDYLATDTLQEKQGHYFLRHSFTVKHSNAISGLTLRARYDDAAIVYLNGVELCRTAPMKNGKVPSHEGKEFETFGNLSSKSLRNGTNTLAVHLFNVNKKSSDVVWDGALLAGSQAVAPLDSKNDILRGPYLQNASQSGISILWRTQKPARGHIQFKKQGSKESHNLKEGISTTEHRIRLEGLETGTTYEYKIVSTDDTPAASAHEFRTLPAAHEAVPTRIWILGDSGTGNRNARDVYKAYQDFTKDRPADLWLMLGDNAYSDGTDQQFQNAVFNMYTPILHNTCLWPAVGNHETTWANKDKNPLTNNQADPYLAIFEMPTRGEGGGVPSGNELYYSFDYGRTHFICLDSQVSSRSKDGAMYRWLEADLATATDANYDWVIAYWHHPPYTHGTHNSDKEKQHIEMRENFLPLLEAHGVDLTFGGHSHTYERSLLMQGHYGMSPSYDPAEHALDTGDGNPDSDGAYRQSQHDGRGTIHTVAGSSGKSGAFRAPHLPFMLVNHSLLASVIVDVDGRSIHVTTLSHKGEVLDSYTLRKD